MSDLSKEEIQRILLEIFPFLADPSPAALEISDRNLLPILEELERDPNQTIISAYLAPLIRELEHNPNQEDGPPPLTAE